MTMTTPKHIAIIGAGTAGLAAAIVCAQRQIRVSLFEQATSLDPVGAGLLLQPAGLAVLEHLGALQSALGLAAKVTGLQGQLASGQLIVNSHYHQADPRFYGLGIHRATLCHVLTQRLEAYADLVQWHMQSSIENCKEVAKQVRLTGLQQGQPFDAIFDAVLICNGAKSRLRPSEWVKFDRPYPWGAVWRIIPECIYDDPKILHQFYHKSQTMLGILPTGAIPKQPQQRLSSIFWSLPQAELTPFIQQPMAQQQILSKVEQHWPKLRPLLEKSLEHADPETPWLTANYRDVVLHKFGQGRVGVLGDAAHAMSPQLGQGANMALLDAWAFGQCLDQVFMQPNSTSNAQDWAAFWQLYHQQRHSSTQFYQLLSRLLTPLYQSSHVWSGPLRDFTFTWMNQIPYFKTQMALTISGLKTSMFSHLDDAMIVARN